MRRRNRINGIEGVGPGATARVSIPVNRRIHHISIRASGVDGEDDPLAVTDVIGDVRLSVNGVLQRNLSSAQYRAIAAANGMTNPDGVVPLYFSEPWRASVTGEESTALDLYGQLQAALEIEIKSGVVNPQVSIVYSYDYDRNMSGETAFVAVIRQMKQTFNMAAGINDLNTLQTRFPIQRLHVIPSAGAVTRAEVTRDSDKVLDLTAAENAEFLAVYGFDSTPLGAGVFSVVFDYEQQISSPLVVQRDLNLAATCSSAGQITVIQEYRANGYS